MSDKLPIGQYAFYIMDSSKHARAQMFSTDGAGLALTGDGGLLWTRANVPQPN